MKKEIALYRRLATYFTIGARLVPQLPNFVLDASVLLRQPTIDVADYELTRAELKAQLQEALTR